MLLGNYNVHSGWSPPGSAFVPPKTVSILKVDMGSPTLPSKWIFNKLLLNWIYLRIRQFPLLEQEATSRMEDWVDICDLTFPTNQHFNAWCHASRLKEVWWRRKTSSPCSFSLIRVEECFRVQLRLKVAKAAAATKYWDAPLKITMTEMRAKNG